MVGPDDDACRHMKMIMAMRSLRAGSLMMTSIELMMTLQVIQHAPDHVILNFLQES